MFSNFFINRPIFASVLSIIITLAGSVALFTLPIAQYPVITPPTIEVSAMYPGANAQVVADTVAAPIEQQVVGVEGMLYMSSQCTNDGTYVLTVTFHNGVDLNMAQVLVQNREALAEPILPDLVKRRGITVKKKSPSTLMIVNLFSPDGTRDNLYLSNYATIQLKDELARLDGVGDIGYIGQRDYSMRLWLDPEKMATLNLSAADVVSAIMQQNTQVAAGQIGQPPINTGQTFQYTITTMGRLADPDEFADMILKADATGARGPRARCGPHRARGPGIRSNVPTRWTSLGGPVHLSIARLECAGNCPPRPDQNGRFEKPLPARHRLFHRLRHDAVH